MGNDRLREALTSAGLSHDDAAESLDVDRKTVERWVAQGRIPYPRSRNRLAALLNESETYLWPDAYSDEQKAEASESELVNVYARRGHVPQALWKRLLTRRSNEIDILVIAGLFLPEQDPQIPRHLHDRTEEGAQVRLLMADPDSEAVRVRGDEEGIGNALAERVRNTEMYFESAAGCSCIDRRHHSTTLYNSIFRFDNEMLVSAHVYGLAGAHAPVLHLKRISGGEMFETYEQAFERVWATTG